MSTPKTITPYEAIRDTLHTGDNVLCQGRGLISLLIRIVTMGEFSHLGKIIRKHGRVWITHSTSLGKGVDGVQRPELLSQFIKNYKGKVIIRKLIGFDPYTPAAEQITEEWINDHEGKRYERNIWELMGAAMPWRNKPDFSTLFCTEYGADWDIRQGLLPPSPPANEYHPNDYALGRNVDNRLKRWHGDGVCLSAYLRLK